MLLQQWLLHKGPAHCFSSRDRTLVCEYNRYGSVFVCVGLRCFLVWVVCVWMARRNTSPQCLHPCGLFLSIYFEGRGCRGAGWQLLRGAVGFCDTGQGNGVEERVANGKTFYGSWWQILQSVQAQESRA